MHNFKLFPSSKLPANSDENDRRFLEHMINARKDCNARYVNFSVYHYEPANIEPIHIITYPMDWIIHYIQSQYQTHDPLFKIDYRRVSCIDWADVYSDEKSEPLFREFQERHLGNQGITLSSRVRENHYAVASFVFQIGDEMWTAHRSANMEMLRLQTVNLSEHHEAVYFKRQIKDYKITNRERQCLYWVAMGKTDEQIAKILSIGRWTVVGHLKSAKFKLGSSNRAAAVATAISLEIIDIGAPKI